MKTTYDSSGWPFELGRAVLRRHPAWVVPIIGQDHRGRWRIHVPVVMAAGELDACAAELADNVDLLVRNDYPDDDDYGFDHGLHELESNPRSLARVSACAVVAPVLSVLELDIRDLDIHESTD